MLTWIRVVWETVAAATAMDWALVTVATAAVAYVFGTWTYGHFKRHGLPYVNPVPFFGSMAPVTLGTESFSDFVTNIYYRFENHSIFGLFQFLTPIVLVKDPEVIKKIAVKDFDHFVDHQALVTEKLDPVFSRNLFSLRGQEWRDMRITLSPAFTSSKMRNIFKLIDKCGEQTVNFLKKDLQNNPRKIYETEMKDFFTRFANDVIATSAFGIQCDSLGNKNNEFYMKGRDLTNSKGTRALLILGYLLSPKLMELLNLPFLKPDIRDFFHGIVHETISERKKQGIHRPDMLQLLIQAREGQLKAEAGDEQEVVKNAKTLRLSDTDITAQAVIFFFAGFDTVSTLMSFTSMELARHPAVQQRLQREIDEAVENAGWPLPYEKVQELKYLDMVLNETLRLYPPVSFLNRLCVSDYTIESKGDIPAYTIRKDEAVWIPAFALHRDPKYWTDPEVFDPERFSDENKVNIKPFTYMPFGLGPRLCIGNRFALLETKLVMTHILHNFSFQCTSKTPKVVRFAKRDLNTSVEGGFWVGIAPRAK